MANNVQQDRIQLTVEVNGKQVSNTLKDIRSQYTAMLRLRNSATRGSDEFKKYNAEAARLKTILDENRVGFKQAESGANSFFASLKKGLGPLAAFAAGGALVGVTKQFLGIATQLDQLDQKAETVFGDALVTVEQFADRNAAAMGLTRDEYIATAVAAGDLLIPMGFQREEAAELSNDLVGLSGALAEWTGGQIDSEETSRILTKALLGEREELKQLGISIKESDVQTRLAAKGQEELTGTALEQAKAVATLELITEKSADAQQAYAENTGNLVRQQAQLAASLGEIRDRIARALIPAFRSAIGFLNDLTGGTRAYSQELEKEQLQLNVTVGKILEYEEGTEARTKAIDDLQKRYPDFLGNLNAETVSNTELANRLREVNEQYVNRIVLQRRQEEIQQEAEKTADLLTKKLEAEQKVREALAQNARGNFALTEEELSKNLSLEEKVLIVRQRRNDAGVASRDFLGQLTDAEAQYNEQLEKQIGLEEDRQELAGQLGINLGGGAPAATTPTAPVFDPTATKRAEAREKSERDLSRKIQDLQAELIEDELQKKLRLIELAAEREIEALEGTEEQKAQAIELINERRRAQELQAISEDIDAQQARRDEAADNELARQERDQARALKELDDYHSKRTSEITQQVLKEAQAGEFVDQSAAQQAIQDRLLAEYRAYLEKRIALLKQYGRDVSELEGELAKIDLGAVFGDAEGDEAGGESPGDKFLEKLARVADAASQIVGRIYDLQAEKAEAAYDQQVDALNTAKDKELARYRNDARKREEIEAKFQKKQDELDLQYKKKQKTRAITQSIIQTALATVTALGTPPAPNVPAAILAGALGGIETAIISAQKFAAGGMRIGAVSNNPAGHVDKPTLFIAGEAGKEWIAPNWMLDHPEYGPQIQGLEQARVRAFADGGLTSPSAAPPSVSDNAVAVAGLDKQDMQIRLLQEILAVSRAPRLAAVVTEKNAMDINDMTSEVSGRRLGTALG